MTPGRSLPPNTIDRSTAPAASTARFATIFHSRCRGRWAGGHRQMIRDALQRAEGSGTAEPVVVGAEHRGSPHQPHFRHRTQLGLDPPRPIAAAQVVDFMALVVEAAAEQKILVAEDDARTGASGGERGGETGRARRR